MNTPLTGSNDSTQYNGSVSYESLISGAPGNLPVDIGEERLSALKRQLETRLRPVLRRMDYQKFDLELAINRVITMAKNLRSSQE